MQRNLDMRASRQFAMTGTVRRYHPLHQPGQGAQSAFSSSSNRSPRSNTRVPCPALPASVLSSAQSLRYSRTRTRDDTRALGSSRSVSQPMARACERPVLVYAAARSPSGPAAGLGQTAIPFFFDSGRSNPTRRFPVVLIVGGRSGREATFRGDVVT